MGVVGITGTCYILYLLLHFFVNAGSPNALPGLKVGKFYEFSGAVFCSKM
jgi:hypothetical protein